MVRLLCHTLPVLQFGSCSLLFLFFRKEI
uniref:Uncharacterized protein n=1 Tax=Arundo donax TaxID=35708 RepID=A0A0A8YFK7_ARUDO